LSKEIRQLSNMRQKMKRRYLTQSSVRRGQREMEEGFVWGKKKVLATQMFLEPHTGLTAASIFAPSLLFALPQLFSKPFFFPLGRNRSFV